MPATPSTPAQAGNESIAGFWGRRAWLQATLASAAIAALPDLAGAQEDPLPSWNEGLVKRTITDFVSDVTWEGGPRFVEPTDRIAIFDHDGTLWCEKPTIEEVYMTERVKALLAKRPELRRHEPYASLVVYGDEALSQLKIEDKLRIMADTHTGMTEEEFVLDVQRFFATARHPKFSVPYLQMTYLPQLELLRYLRANGFATWICSEGEVAFTRVLAEQNYGIPTERVIGTYFRSRLEELSDRLVLRRTDQIVSFNDKDAKPMNIQHQIGRRPILAVGNERSGGDIAMLRYSQGHALPSLAMLIEHDDSKREYAYEEPDGASLEAARRYGFAVVSMKRDWRQIFTFQADIGM